MSGKIWSRLLFTFLLWAVACVASRGDDPPDAASVGSSPDTPDNPSTGDSPTTETPTTDPVPGSTGGLDSTGSSTSGEALCGNGKNDPGEECDDGPQNSNTGACTQACVSAACGDGYVQAGVEQCDAGEANADGWSGCSTQCTYNPRCGDGALEPGFEQCDNGDDLNGSGVGVDGMAPCSKMCRWSGFAVFISSKTYTGDFNGIDYADLACRSLAEAAGLARADSFRAWISAGFDSPLTRFELIDAGIPYILLDGRVLSDDFLELIEDGPLTGISITEEGEKITERFVWTNTSPVGEPYSMAEHCLAWTSSDKAHLGRLGYNALPVELGADFQVWRSERHWTSYVATSCSKTAHLYCFQDGLEENAI
jgi:hypothetical protein